MRTYAFAIAALLALGAAALLLVPTSGSHVASTVRIHREIADVFAFFTTPKNWPRWHPASISVAGATDHSLAAGEEATRGIPHGRRERASGLARHRKQRAFFVAHQRGAPESGDVRVTIAYSLRMDGQDTVFERNMQYQFNRLWLRVLDLLLYSASYGAGGSPEALWNAERILEH